MSASPACDEGGEAGKKALEEGVEGDAQGHDGGEARGVAGKPCQRAVRLHRAHEEFAQQKDGHAVEGVDEEGAVGKAAVHLGRQRGQPYERRHARQHQ